jgi:hypothetical protein
MKKIGCEVEEKIASFQMPKNNTFPLWCYGAPTIVRHNDHVYVTIPEASLDIPPMCNTRLQLFRKKGNDGWQRLYVNPVFDQREPCPIASLGDGKIIVSINSAIVPFRGNEHENWLMWQCEPYLLSFNENEPENKYPEVIKPEWDTDWPFTDHSYRGLATDPVRNELFVMNIEGYQWKSGPQGRYHWAFRDATGNWLNNGLLEFPVRCCYPCISLKNRRLNIVATSDIDEPNAEWMAYKRDFAGIPWDYDFRKLYYVDAEDIDIKRNAFNEPVVIESCEDTAGHIKHLDLFVDDDNTAHILYISRNICKPFMRDKFWPEKTITASLKVARVKEGRILSKQILASCREDINGRLWSYGKPSGEKNTGDSFRTNDDVPNHAAFHATPDGRLFVIYNLGGFNEGGTDLAKNYLVEISQGQSLTPVEVKMGDPMKIFFTAPARNGSTPGNLVDLFGVSKNQPDQINYARINLSSI